MEDIRGKSRTSCLCWDQKSGWDYRCSSSTLPPSSARMLLLLTRNSWPWPGWCEETGLGWNDLAGKWRFGYDLAVVVWWWNWKERRACDNWTRTTPCPCPSVKSSAYLLNLISLRLLVHSSSVDGIYWFWYKRHARFFRIEAAVDFPFFFFLTL